ncbi:MAG: hypothetical protein ACYC0B_09985 [Gemmatimonadaceae bacterium]
MSHQPYHHLTGTLNAAPPSMRNRPDNSGKVVAAFSAAYRSPNPTVIA